MAQRGAWKKRLGVSLVVIASVLVVTGIVFAVSPWPGAMIVRGIFERGAAKISKIMAPYAPTGIDSVLDVQYADEATDPHVTPNEFTQLDVYYPTGTTKQLGTVIWTHGGAWISGNKSNDAVYFQLLASHGYTVVGLNYTYGPEAMYPTAVFELNQAHRFLVKNAERFHIDPNNIVLAGDSAGAQLSSQLAALITNPGFAQEMDFTPALMPAQVKGMVLNCGVYDVSTLLGAGGIIGWGDDVALWAYTGDRDLVSSAAVTQMSTLNFVTADFPPSYISGGNADPLTAGNSVPLANRLKQLGVSVDELFWPADYTPALPHEYQFHLDLQAGQDALAATVKFLDSQLGPGITP